MPPSLPGFHAYYQYPGRAVDYPALTALAQVCSALHYKTLAGSITLVANDGHLEWLADYNGLAAYDEVAGTVLSRLPEDPRYWSLAKVYAAEFASQQHDAFTILDTDLWVRRWPTQVNWQAGLIGLHRETFADKPDSIYPPPATFLQDSHGLPWQEDPLNCAFLCFQSPALVREWRLWVDQVLIQNASRPPLPQSRDTLFMEQRLLPVLASALNLPSSTLVPAAFNADYAEPENSWSPPLNSSEYLLQCQDDVRHIWETKRHYYKADVRQAVHRTLITDLTSLGVDLSPYGQLLQQAEAEALTS